MVPTDILYKNFKFLKLFEDDFNYHQRFRFEAFASQINTNETAWGDYVESFSINHILISN